LNSQISDKPEFINSTNSVLGKTIQSDKYQITMDEFWFSIFEDNIVEPFDFISVENIHDTVTIGIVKELRTIRNTEIKISTQISSSIHNNLRKSTSSLEDYVDQGIRIARVVVMTNSRMDEIQSNSKTKYKGNIRMPVNIDKTVRFATEKEIFIALGIPKMEDPVMAGVIEMSNGQMVAIPIAMSYLAGPDTAHINASGISGNLKTSYVMFLLHSMYQKLIKNEEVQNWDTFAKYLFSCYLFGPTSFKVPLYDGLTIKDCVPTITHPVFCRYVHSIKNELRELLDTFSDEINSDTEDYRYWPSDHELQEMEINQKEYWRSQKERR